MWLLPSVRISKYPFEPSPSAYGQYGCVAYAGANETCSPSCVGLNSTLAAASGFNEDVFSFTSVRRDFLSQNPLLTAPCLSSGRSARGRTGGGGETTALRLGLGECVDDGVNEGLNSFAPGLNTNSFAPGLRFFVVVVVVVGAGEVTVATGAAGPTCLTVPGSKGVGLAMGLGTDPGVLV